MNDQISAMRHKFQHRSAAADLDIIRMSAET
jgi:hypothetical protein